MRVSMSVLRIPNLLSPLKSVCFPTRCEGSHVKECHFASRGNAGDDFEPDNVSRNRVLQRVSYTTYNRVLPFVSSKPVYLADSDSLFMIKMSTSTASLCRGLPYKSGRRRPAGKDGQRRDSNPCLGRGPSHRHKTDQVNTKIRTLPEVCQNAPCFFQGPPHKVESVSRNMRRKIMSARPRVVKDVVVVKADPPALSMQNASPQW